MKITDFFILDTNGNEMPADAHGNNLAFNCWSCGHPVLIVALENQRGFDEEHLAECKGKGCNSRYFLDIRSHKDILYVHQKM